MKVLLVALLVLVSLLVPVPVSATDITVVATPPTVEPLVTSDSTTNVTDVSAILHGNITDTGGDNPTIRGFEWGLAIGNYTFNWTETGNFSAGAFEHQILNLTLNVTYFWRAFAVNIIGQGNGTERSFNTSTPIPLPPSNFMATQLDTSTVRLNWTPGAGASTATIRMSSERYPSSIIEGYLVYTGNETYCNVTGLTLDELDAYYFSAWSENEAGYSLTYSTAKIGGISMTSMIVGIISLGAMIAGFALSQLLILIGAGIGWVVFGFLMYATTIPSDLNTALLILGMVFALVCFVWTWGLAMKTRRARPDPDEEYKKGYTEKIRNITRR